VNRIEEAGRFGARVHYGDGTRLDVLRAAGAERVRMILVCTDRPEVTSRIVGVVQEAFPGTPCFVRAWDRRHALELLARGIDGQVRDTLESALALGREALVGLGVPRDTAVAVEEDVRQRDRERLKAQQLGGLFVASDHYKVRPEPLTPLRREKQPG